MSAKITKKSNLKGSLKIYLGDLTYDTVAVSTNGIPLNIGYIASYCIQRFGSDIEIVLFKYIGELEQAILTSPPDILGLSNYCWNQNIGHEMFSLLHKKNPNALSVWGGPNFHKNKLLQEQWLDNFPETDVYIPLEGEVGFGNVVEEVLKMQNRKKIRSNIRATTIDNCIVRNLDGNYVSSGPSNRITNLDGIPSPYLTGILDKFFDGKLDPCIQTSRGCPFTCTFCVDGSDQVKKVNRFCLDRVTKELNYIAKRVPSNVHTLGVMDLNFGMYKGDLQICDAILDVQKKYNYPKSVATASGKNAKELIIKTCKKLRGSLILRISVQSMDKKVLKNINRDNISEERMMELAPTIRESGLQTCAEVILGLPGDTYDSHLRTLKTLLEAGIDEILVFSCMLLPGSEMFEERKKWGLKTKHRILPRDFAKLSSGKIVVETEEVVIGSDTMTFDEYVELRLFNFLLSVTNMDIAYSPLKKFLKEHNIGIFDLVSKMLKNLDNAPDCIKNVCNDYKNSTINELWDSSEEIISQYQQESEFKKLLNGEEGINVLYHHLTLVMINYTSEWTTFVFATLKTLLNEKKIFSEVLSNQFNEVLNYSLGVSFNPLGKNRMSTNPKYEFYYDMIEWLNISNSNLPLSRFRLDSKAEIEFRYSEDQYNFIQDQLERFDHNIVAASKALFATTSIPAHYFWRKPFVENNSAVNSTYSSL